MNIYTYFSSENDICNYNLLLSKLLWAGGRLSKDKYHLATIGSDLERKAHIVFQQNSVNQRLSSSKATDIKRAQNKHKPWTLLPRTLNAFWRTNINTIKYNCRIETYNYTQSNAILAVNGR